MNMKKKIAPLLAAALVAANALPVMADEISGGVVGATQDVSNAQQTGSTTVVASVQGTDPGAVTYTVSIPSYVDFGGLKRGGESGTEYSIAISGEVKLTAVESLGSNMRIAVLVQDAKNGTDGFRIYGTTGAALSNAKYLNYDILTVFNADENNLIDDTVYSNGFLVGAFQNLNDSVPLKFRLNQNQMIGQLDDWAGTYQGTLNFYSRVAEVGDYQ